MPAVVPLLAALISAGLPTCELYKPELRDVQATVETAPMSHTGDAADDASIWVHPSAREQSLVIGADKQGALVVYDLTGAELQRIEGIRPNNVDLRYGFDLGGTATDLVCASDRQTLKGIVVYKVNPGTRQLEPAGSATAGINVYGLCMYRSAAGDYYCFVNSSAGEVEQWKLADGGSGQVNLAKVRSFVVGTTTEGCLADDETGDFYIAEEDVGIWKYGADPGDGTDRVSLDSIGTNRDLASDLEGLALYRTAGGGGYLIASVQGRSAYAVYERQSGAYLGLFRIAGGVAVDGTSDTDGIDVVNVSLGAAFPQGMFVAQDGSNTDPAANQDFKLVPWEQIAQAFDPVLAIDSTYGVRP
jgi:3-phytase